MAVGDNWKVTICCYTPTQISLNDFFVQTLSEGANPPTAAAVAESIDIVMAPLYKPWMSSLARYRGVAVSKVSIPLPTATAGVSRDGVGTGTAVLCPTQVSGLVGFKTAFAGRHFRGRVYPGFVDDAFKAADGSLTAPGLVVLNNLAFGFLTLWNATDIVAPFGTGVLGTTVRARIEDLPPATPPTFTITYNRVLSAIGRSRFATQRRRGQFGKTNVVPF